MKAVIQRTSEMSVNINGSTYASCGKGLLVLVSAEKGDSIDSCRYLAGKCAGLRIFEDSEGKMNLALSDIGGELLIISNFTLSGDCVKGRRPSFFAAMEPVEAEILYEIFIEECKKSCVPVKSGVFGADMKVSLVNDGPVTIQMDTKLMR